MRTTLDATVHGKTLKPSNLERHELKAGHLGAIASVAIHGCHERLQSARPSENYYSRGAWISQTPGGVDPADSRGVVELPGLKKGAETWIRRAM